MQNDPPQDERKQRAEQLRDQWRRKEEQSHVDLASLSTRERNHFFIEIAVWWSVAVLFFLGACICALLCISPIFSIKNTFLDALLETKWHGYLGATGFFVCLFVARWMSRSPSRRAKARQSAVKRGEDPPTDEPDEFEGVLSNMLDNAPTKPNNMYGDED